jgi:hypothetical protein
MLMAHRNITSVTNTTYHVSDVGDTQSITYDVNNTYNIPNGTIQYASEEGSLQPPVMMSDPGLMQLQLHVRNLHLYYLPTVYCLALLGNVFGIVILTDSVLKKLSSTQYLIGILVVEIIHVLTQLHTWIEDNGWNTGMFRIGGWCQFTTFASHISLFLSVWYTVFLSIDGYARFSFTVLCKTWIARSSIAGAAIVAIVVYLNISILYGTVSVGSQLICVQLQIFKDTHQKLACGDVIVNALIPTVLLIILIALTMRQMCCSGNSNRHRYKHPPALPRSQIDNNLDQNGTRLAALHKPQTINQFPPPSSTGFIVAFLIVHVSLCMPLDAYHFVQIIGDFVSPAAAGPSLKGFLLERIFQYIRSAKCVLNVIVLFGAYPVFRAACGRLPTRLRQSLQVCRRHKYTHTDIELIT